MGIKFLRTRCSTSPTILILTAQFPYPGGEYFLESEVPQWNGPYTVIIAPVACEGTPRQVPPNVRTDSSIAQMRKSWGRFKYLHAARALAHPLFWTEMRLLGADGLKERRFLSALATVAMVNLSCRGLKRIVRRYGRPILVYSYWCDLEAYAAILAKRGGRVDTVVARAHNFDVYAERRMPSYMPLKKQFIKELDALFPVSEHARRYLITHFNADESRASVQRLGVRLPPEVARISPKGRLHLLSISNCRDIKRIDRIIGGIARAATLREDLIFSWTHIGDGELRSELESLASSTFGDTSNVEHIFAGAMSNAEVQAFFRCEPVDLMINTSDFEGIPVSIMEAMSYGVPAIATDVGGVSELVRPQNGWLLPPDPTPAEVAVCILDCASSTKMPELRDSARATIAKRFDGEINYKAFVDLCLALPTCGKRTT